MRYMFLMVVCVALSATAQTTEQVEGELRKQRVPHADIVLAQARLETGNFTSRRCRVDHNLFGMKRGKRYAKYRRWQDSVADYKERISSRYVKGDYYAFLRKIGYAEEKEYIQKVRRIANGMARH
jgi:flagellum-specific peptidoglycan hydrolase FlgJ